MEHDEHGREVYASLDGAPNGWYVGDHFTLWFVRDGVVGLADSDGKICQRRKKRDDRWSPYLRAPGVPDDFAGDRYREAKLIALRLLAECRLDGHNRALREIEAARCAAAREAAISRSGTRPRTVEVGMVLCRPADGVGASAWRVQSVQAGVSAVLVDHEGVGPRLSVAIAAIVHESGGWVLAEDWTKPAEGEAAR